MIRCVSKVKLHGCVLSDICMSWYSLQVYVAKRPLNIYLFTLNVTPRIGKKHFNVILRMEQSWISYQVYRSLSIVLIFHVKFPLTEVRASTLWRLIDYFALGLDSCSSNPCRNGSCSQSEDGYTCNCTAGYSGESCDKGNPEKNVCLSMQFLHLKYVLQIHLSFGKGWFQSQNLNDNSGERGSLQTVNHSMSRVIIFLLVCSKWPLQSCSV